MKDKKVDEMKETDAFLEHAAAEHVEIPQSLLARVLRDADALQPKTVSENEVFAGRSVFGNIRNALGGLSGLAGLAAASCVGFWIGINPPANFPDATDFLFEGEDYSSYDESGEISGFGWALSGG